MTVIADPGDALFRIERVADSPPDGVSQPGLLHVDGLRGSGGVGGDGRPAQAAAHRPGRRRGLPNDRMELSTIVRYGFAPVVIFAGQRGYGTERMLLLGEHKFNDVHPWHYSKLPEVLGAGRGYEVRTEGEFDHALSAAFGRRRAVPTHPRPSRPQRLQHDLGAADDKAADKGVRRCVSVHGQNVVGILRVPTGLFHVRSPARYVGTRSVPTTLVSRPCKLLRAAVCTPRAPREGEARIGWHVN